MADVFVQVLLLGTCQSGNRNSSRVLIGKNDSIPLHKKTLFSQRYIIEYTCNIYVLLLAVNSLLNVNGSIVSSREAVRSVDISGCRSTPQNNVLGTFSIRTCIVNIKEYKYK